MRARCVSSLCGTLCFMSGALLSALTLTHAPALPRPSWCMSAPPPAPPPPPPPAICSSSLRPRGPQARPPEINLDAFFETCFGFREDVSDLPGLYARLSVTDGPEGALLSSSANDRTFRCGTFTMKRAGDFKVPTAPAGGGEGTLSLVVGEGVQSYDLHAIDVGAQQMDPANRGV